MTEVLPQELPTVYQSYIHQTRYARWDDERGRRETWPESVDRYVRWFESQCARSGYELPEADREAVRAGIQTLRAMPSMRAFMTAGKALDKDQAAGYNCCYLVIDHPRALDEAMYLLMCGCGVGFSVERQYVGRLPEVPEEMYPCETVITVADSRVGWASGFKQLLHLLWSGHVPRWDLSKLRPAGARLRTFGGRSSGPGPLDALFRFAVELFGQANGRRLTSLECHSLMCKVGDVVVSGGVRRSALISLSNPSDERMRDAKSGDWHTANPHFALANNSAVWTDVPDPGRFLDEVASLYKSKSGERGIVYRGALQEQAAKHGRRDPDVDYGVNPCCVAGDTWIMTTEGPQRISDLRGTPFTAVVDGETYDAPRGSWVAGRARPLIIKTAEGYELVLTDEHRVLTPHQGWVPATDLEEGSWIVVNDHREASDWGSDDDGHGYLLGLFVGDGNFYKGASVGAKSLGEIKVWVSDIGSGSMAEKAYEYASVLPHRSDWGGWRSHGKYDSMSIGALPTLYDLEPGAKHDIEHLEGRSRAFCVAFLRGLFDTDGHVENWRERNRDKGLNVRLGQSDRRLLVSVQRMLLRLGVKSRIYRLHDERAHMLPDGHGGSKNYSCRASWRLVIGSDDVVRFADEVGFVHASKNEQLRSAISNRNFYSKPFVAMVSSVERMDRDIEVWDAHVDVVHAFDANGIYAHNSEIILRPQQMCNLSTAVVRPDDSLDDIRAKVALTTAMGAVQSTVTDFRYLRPQWRRNCEEERLQGNSLTGLMAHPVIGYPTDESARWYREMYDHHRRVAEDWAGRLGVDPPAAGACVKPEGTASQLTRSFGSGMHRWYAPLTIRRTRDSKLDPVAELMRLQGVPCEEDVMNPDNWVFSWPLEAPKGIQTQQDESALDQLRMWLHVNEHWCDHKPSITVNYREDEVVDVAAFVYRNFDRMSGVSFLPRVGSIYQQAPFEAATKDGFETLRAETPERIDWSLLTELEKDDGTTGSRELACTAVGGCDV